jgi:hypothetical protein
VGRGCAVEEQVAGDDVQWTDSTLTPSNSLRYNKLGLSIISWT